LFVGSEGYWSLKDNNYTPGQTTLSGQESLFDTAKAMMDDFDILPQDAEMTVLDTGEFAWNLKDSTNLNADYWTGDIMLDLKQDGSVSSLAYNIHMNEFKREVNILSPAEVYERIKNGEFPQIKYNALVNEEDLVIKKGDQLDIELIELSYMYDTKDFYQPIYRVSGKYNGNDWFTLIQARRS